MELREALARFDGLNILVLGDCFVDEYLTGDCSRLSPEAPVPILRVDPKQTKRVLGGAANTAANIASLGGKPILFALCGQDAAGKNFVELCVKGGLLLEAFSDGRPTNVKTRLLGQQQQLLRMDQEETRNISAGLEQNVLAIFRKHLSQAHAVVLSDYAKGFLTDTLTKALIREAGAAGKILILDPRPQHAAHYENCDTITPNWKECLGLIGYPDQDATPENLKKAGSELRARLRCHVLLTLGSKGIAFFHKDGGEPFHIPTAAREVFDVSGAGDTVVASYALSRAAGLELRHSVELANRAAGIVVGKSGTATVTREEMLHGDADGGRLLSRSQLSSWRDALRAGGQRLVTINGSFDLLHAGHLHILEQARAQGDVLLVGLNSDASIRNYKSKNRPLIPEAERAKILLGLRCVDAVHLFDEEVPMPFLEEAKPDVHVNGSEYGADCIEAPTVKKNGGRIHIVEKIAGLSTSGLLEKIQKLSG